MNIEGELAETVELLFQLNTNAPAHVLQGFTNCVHSNPSTRVFGEFARTAHSWCENSFRDFCVGGPLTNQAFANRLFFEDPDGQASSRVLVLDSESCG